MLSYQHGYHAGNLADVHKHALLAVMLDYLTRKDKPLSYLETHAGRAVYDLAAPEAVKTGEAAAGIGRVEGWFAADHPYARAIAACRARFGATSYPGSPLIAASLLRRGDRMHLAELHPQEHAALAATLAPFGAHVHRRDGAEMALALCPPTPRRGLVLIDPSYEVKADYAAMPQLVRALHRRWGVGIIVLWYPVLASGLHLALRDALQAALPEAMCHEVRFAPARPGHGMVGSGLLVVNPPWGLAQEAAALAALFETLGGGDA